MKRIFCGDLNKQEHLNKEVKVCGWVKNIRKLGSLTFIIVSDISGEIQIISEKEYSLSREDVVTITGKLLERKSTNNKIKNGDLEIKLTKLEINSKSDTTPLLIEETTDALEEVRFQYRYLDLRRRNIQEIFLFKSNLYNFIHNYFYNNKFIYLETPILGKPTPEGARDFLVPSRVKKSNFFALPQSPQIYKQLFMVSGFERYYQIAKCFRDEDMRSDRQPEFTQLDIEMSFINEEDIMAITETFLKQLMFKFKNIEIKEPFLKMNYDDAMLNYGNDKPDMRFDNKILDSTELLKNKNSEFINKFYKQDQWIRTLVFKNNELFSNKLIKDLEKELNKSKHSNMFWIKLENNELSGSLKNKIEKELVEEILKQHNQKEGIVFINIDTYEKASVKLGLVRSYIAEHLNLINKDQYKFLWVINWPLFEYNEEEKRYVAAHHPFTQPQEISIKDFDTNQKEARARSYDIVLNGVEIGGGSIRITSEQIQKRMFNAIGLTQKEYEEKFDILLKAFKYGVPPHGGIALGLDRLIQILLNLNSIKECIPFPKNNKGIDTMFNAPNKVDAKSLEELGILLDNEE